MFAIHTKARTLSDGSDGTDENACRSDDGNKPFMPLSAKLRFYALQKCEKV